MKRIFLSCIFIFLSIYGPACSEDDSNCTNCDEKMDYSYKEIIDGSDLANLQTDIQNLNVDIQLGTCIRYKMNSDNTIYIEVKAVDNCCCIEFQ